VIKAGFNSMTSFAKALGKPVGFFVLLAISIVFAYVINAAQIKGAAIIMIVLIGPIIAFAVISKPKFGITVLLIAAYLIMLILRLDLVKFPMGTLMDGLLGLLIIGLFIQLKYRPDWTFLSSPISLMISIWIIYNFILVVNPVAQSKMAWLYTIRSMAIVMLTYFIFSYHIRDLKFIRFIIKLWLILSVFAGINGYRQQFMGFFAYEEAYLYSDPLIRDLLFINGVWRKFSIFSDPTVFSYNMILSSLLCIGMMFGPISMRKKIFYSALVMFFITNMLFSGTRSAYVLLPAAMLMLTILVFNRQIMLITTGGALFMTVIIFMPTSNPVLYRFQSAFKPSGDASFNVRAQNQKMIQPYIWSHPIGGGLGSTGVWGAKFSPGSFLASFPPDSGYVRVAVETGWIGLFIFCTLLFIILQKGISNFFKMEDPELKSYCLAMVLIVYAITIGNYPQEAITQYPLNVYFFLVAALIDATYNLDKEKKEEKLKAANTLTK